MSVSSPEFKYETMLDEYPDTVIVFGESAHHQLNGFLIKEQVNSVLVFAGGSRSGSLNKAVPTLFTIFPSTDFEVPSYMNIPPEPTVADIRAMRDVIAKEQPDIIVAVGGGSVMDAAKAACLSVEAGMDVTELFGVSRASQKAPGKKFKRIICVPTTAGTGSEVTPYANIVDPETRVKKLIVEPQIIPEYAFVNPHFGLTMPRELTLTTALDALVHCVESELNIRAENAHPSAAAWGIQGIRLISAALPAALEKPENELARQYLSAAATLGGMCIKNRPTSLPHLCSFSFYGQVPHGLAVAALLPPFWNYYLGDDAIREATMKLAGIFSKIPEKTPEQVVASCAAFIASCGGPARLSDLKCPREILAKTARDALLNPVKLQTSPRPLDPSGASDILLKILEKAW